MWALGFCSGMGAGTSSVKARRRCSTTRRAAFRLFTVLQGPLTLVGGSARHGALKGNTRAPTHRAADRLSAPHRSHLARCPQIVCQCRSSGNVGHSAVLSGGRHLPPPHPCGGSGMHQPGARRKTGPSPPAALDVFEEEDAETPGGEEFQPPASAFRYGPHGRFPAVEGSLRCQDHRQLQPCT
jgi:hypothetical protein